MVAISEGECRSKTWLAPLCVAKSKFLELQMARTVMPAAAAICVVVLPTEEEAPFTMRTLVVEGVGEEVGRDG